MTNVRVRWRESDHPREPKGRPTGGQFTTKSRPVIRVRFKGGPGSGNFGHAGRPGQVGGSAAGDGRSFSNAKDATNYLNGSTGINPSLSTEEDNALARYKGDTFFDVNAILRGTSGGELSEEGYEAMERDISLIDSAMNKSRLDDDVTIWRGAGWDVFDEDDLTGSIITDDGFPSTSLSKRIAESHADGVILKIHATKGSRGLNMERWKGGTRGEAELLLPRNSKFRVVGDNIDDDPDLREIVLELLG